MILYLCARVWVLPLSLSDIPLGMLQVGLHLAVCSLPNTLPKRQEFVSDCLRPCFCFEHVLFPLKNSLYLPIPLWRKQVNYSCKKSVCVVGRVGGRAMPPTNPIEMHWLFIYIHTFFNKNVN